jgi:glucose-1-phosphate cytidylyltransferase
MVIQDQLVGTFKEKPQTSDGWINGGYFVLHRQILDLIAGDETIFEAEPLHLLAEKRIGPLSALLELRDVFLIRLV